MSQSSELKRIADGVVGFSTEVKGNIDSLNEKLDKVLTRHYQANHTPYAVMSFEDEYHYWEEQLAEVINRIEYPDYDVLEPKGVEMLQRRSYVIVRGNLKSGNTIHFDNTKFNQLYINGERYTGDYTFNGETPETYERFVIVAVQTPFNLGVKDYGKLEMTVADFPIENAEIFVNIGKYSELQPVIEELLVTDTAESLYVRGNWLLRNSEFSPINTFSVTGIFNRSNISWTWRCIKNLFLPNTSGVFCKSYPATIRNIDISNATGGMEKDALKGSSIHGTLNIPKIEDIGQSALAECPFIEYVNVGNSLKTINNSAFQICPNLKKFNIPDSVTGLGSYIFNSCSSLQSLTIGNGVSSLPADAVSNCKALTEVTLGNKITSVHQNAFVNSTAIKTIKVNKGYHCALTNIYHSTVIDWKCFKEIVENCDALGEDDRTAATMTFKVHKDVLTALDNAKNYSGDDEALLADKELANYILDTCTAKQITITG